MTDLAVVCSSPTDSETNHTGNGNGKGDFNWGRVQIFSISGFSAQNCPRGAAGIEDWLGVMGSSAVIVFYEDSRLLSTP